MSDGSRLSQDKKKGEKIITSNAIPIFPHKRTSSKRTAKKVSNQVTKLTNNRANTDH